MRLSDLDQKIAENYIAAVTTPIKYGENGAFFWFPGSGMTTILKDIFSSKKLLKKALGKLYEQVKIVEFFGHLTDKKDFSSLLIDAGFSDYEELKSICTEQLESGYEPVYVIGRIDDFSDAEKLSILKKFAKLQALNPRRVHLLFHSMNKPWFINALREHPELLVFANRIEIMPMIRGDLLDKYIQSKSQEYNYSVSEDEQEKIKNNYGGVLQLTKEYLRSKGNTATLELKLRIVWNVLPEAYRNIIQTYISGDMPQNEAALISDLSKLGILDLKVFDIHKKILDINPDKILQKLLTEDEMRLFKYCKRHTGEVISRDQVTEILRPENAMDVSFWALDKAVSRFRKKLAKSGIDPENFKTLKGKGYVWIS